MNQTKVPVTFENLGDNKYMATDGKRKLIFQVGDQYTITILQKPEGGKKPILFYGSKPTMMLAVGRLLKHIAGFVLAMQKEAKGSSNG